MISLIGRTLDVDLRRTIAIIIQYDLISPMRHKSYMLEVACKQREVKIVGTMYFIL